MNGLRPPALQLDTTIRVPSALGAALGVLFIVPFLVYYRPPPIPDFHTEWMGVVLFAAVVASAVVVVPKKLEVAWGLLALPFVLALIIFIHLALGRYIYAYDWVLWLAYLSVFALAVVLGQGLRGAGLLAEVTNRLAWAILFTSLLQFFTQVAQLFRLEDALAPFVVHSMKGSVCRVHGNIGQANQATTMAWFGIAAALYLIETRKLAWVLGLIVVALLLVSSALTASRMAWLFAVIVAVATLWGNLEAQRPLRRRLAATGVIVATFAVANLLAIQLIHAQDATCASGLTRLANEGDLSIRWNLWRQAFLVWTAHPWFGSGAGNFMSMVYVMDQAPGGQPLDYYAHNSLLQLLAEFGVLGAAAGLGFLVWGAWSVFGTRRELNPHRLLLLTWVAVLLTYSMLEFPLWYMHFLIFFGLSLGLLVIPRGKSAATVPYARSMLGVSVVALLAGCAYAAYDYRKAERAFFLITDAQAMGVFGSPELTKALDEISNETHLYRVHLEYALGARMQMTTDNLSSKLEENERLLKKLPIAGTVAREVMLLALAGDLEGARWHLRRLLKFAPPSTDEAIDAMRRILKDYPERFAPLGRVLDEELAAAPKRNW